MKPRSWLLLTLALSCLGCAAPCPRDGSGEAPRLVSSVPVRLVARVESFENLGGFIDFPDVTVRYHSIVLVSEDDVVGWKSVRLQYQGLPMVDGKRLELGQRLRFTLPAATEGCCAPYLKDIEGVEFLGGK